MRCALQVARIWPDAREVDARIDWRGPRMHASIEKGHAGSFELSATKADWDVRGERIAHITGHVSGTIEDAIAWMRSHPKLQQYAPRVQNIEMRGAASLDFNLALPPGVDASTATASDIQAHVTAVLEGARLEAVAGMPPMDALRGTLVFDSGYLRRSTLVGTWLGGPVTLNVGERRERGALVLSIQGRGVMNARHLARAATAGTVIDETLAPAGNAEWTGELAYLAGNDSRPAHWRVRADSSLVGVVSHLPEPLMKSAAAAVPLHVEAQGTADEAQLRLSLGDRLRGVLALTRQRGSAARESLGAGRILAGGESPAGRDDATWRVERGNVQFGSAAAVLPGDPVVLVEGRVGRLDLPAYVAAWQQLREEPAAAPIRADLVAGEMLVAGRGYADVRVLARGPRRALLSNSSPPISLERRIGPQSRIPAIRHSFISPGSTCPVAARLQRARSSSPRWGRRRSCLSMTSCGKDTRSAARRRRSSPAETLVDVTDLRMNDSTQEVSGTLHCQNTACRLKFNLDSTNAAATLADFGFRPDLTAAKAAVEGDLEWQVGADRPALATLAGRLNLRLEDGVTRTARHDPDAAGTPFALLLVPALMSGIDQGTSSRMGCASRVWKATSS